MNSQPFMTAAKEWLAQIEKKKKLNKEARRAVMSFGIWMDDMIQKQEEREEMKHEQEN